jgi:FkbM family methyltransferase
MKHVNGWHLPSKDGYFTRFVEGDDFKNDGFQRAHLELAMRHVVDFDVAIDVGAHVGFWSVDMAKRFAQVFAFEPAPDTYECLIKNTEQHKNVICANVAIGAESGSCLVAEDTKRNGNTGARFVLPGPGEGRMIALDDLNFIGCDLLKIDVEGFEWAVLRGARALIKAYKPVVIMETDKTFPGRYALPSAIMQLLELGYKEDRHLEPGVGGRQKNAIRPDRIFIPE